MRIAALLAVVALAAIIGLAATATSPARADSTPSGQPSVQQDGFVFGDFDCNNVVDLDDALLGLAVLDTDSAPAGADPCQANGDLDCDGNFTAVDILVLVRHLADTAMSFEGCPHIGDVEFVLSPECANLDQPQAIPDGGGNATLNFDFPESREVLGLALCLNIDHPLVGDLVITLEHVETTTKITLVDRVGIPANAGNCTGHNQGLAVLFADSAGETLQEHCTNAANSEFTGDAFQPDEALSAFTGEDVNGQWIVTVEDAQSGNAGAITGGLFTYIYAS